MDREYTDRFLRTTSGAVAKATNEPQAVLHAAFEAIINGNFEAFGEWLADDAELNVCGFGPLDGSWHGRADVLAATAEQLQPSG